MMFPTLVAGGLTLLLIAASDLAAEKFPAADALKPAGADSAMGLAVEAVRSASHAGGEAASTGGSTEDSQTVASPH